LFCQGNLKESSAYILSALKYLERTRDWHQLSGLHVLRHLHSLRGDVLDAIAVSKNEGQAAAAIGDVVVAQWAKYGEAESLARMGHLDHAIQLVNETVESLGQNLSRSIAQCEKARILLQASDYEGAEIAAHTGIKMMRSDLYLIEYPIHNFGLYVEALIGCDCFTPSQLRSKKVIRKAWWASLSARFFATQFRNTRAQTYRACGRVAAASGKKRKAEIWFNRAKLAAEKFENKFEYARSLIDWSLVHDAETSQATCEEGLAILDSLHTVLPKSEREIIQQRFGIACPELRE
jgi:tetratricopeptide (TPR) repeat protein